jgi:hypothetical protein
LDRFVGAEKVFNGLVNVLGIVLGVYAAGGDIKILFAAALAATLTSSRYTRKAARPFVGITCACGASPENRASSVYGHASTQ